MSKPIRVLYVDTDPDFADLTAAYLGDEDGRFAVERATNAECAMELQAGGHFDCVVVEYDLPDADGVRFLERVRDDAPDLPFVVFTDAGSEEVASAAITAGVTDYVRKGGGDALDRLADRIEDAVQPDGGDVVEGYVADVVDRDEVESSVLPQYRRLLEEHELVLDRMTDVFTALDTDWRITYLNEGGRQAIVSNLQEDLSKEELVGRHFWSINSETSEAEIAETALYRSCHEAMERQEMVTHEKYYEDGDYWVYTRVYPSETGVSIFSRDITERKKKERELERRIEQLEEYERQIERLEEFAGIVSHDLRNPLNVAQGRLELARETGDLDHLEAVARSHDRMAALVEDLLVLAREGAEIESLDRVELARQVEESWETVETADASIDVRIDRTIRAESSRLAQLLENLFRNSVEHSSTSPRSTRSRDEALEHRDRSVTVRVVPLEGGFAVEDDGPGIPAGEREEVFEPGYSTAEDGTGFGLQIVKDVADAHGWEVTLTDSLDGGARFEFTGVEEA